MKKLFILPAYFVVASLSMAEGTTDKVAIAQAALSPSSQNPSKQSGPIRVLFVGTEEEDSRKHCHTVMRDFGREALWFDYAADPAQVTPEWIATFDAVLLDAPASAFPALSSVPEGKVVTAEFSSSSGNPASESF